MMIASGVGPGKGQKACISMDKRDPVTAVS